MEAQFNLGQLYTLGHGTVQDYGKAAEWLEKAAAKGHPKALNNLGMASLDGMGVPMDRVKAGEYFRKAALLGNAHAQYNLATLYVQHPDALTKDKRSKTDALALQWFKKSAAAGHPAAMAYLADVYTYGKLGQRPNRKLAASWKQKADAAEEKRKRAQTITPLPRTEAARPAKIEPVKPVTKDFNPNDRDWLE